ncbi:hypothetical protein [Desnuesiella massiliensis]|uniref:hypothetical protein n=1 Tax=Desnuesiella massiliensis TaxID=1650662 RepID=UPI0006E20D60|nr:hypothetical protein [Desnuesiella massiliensis]
MDWIEQLVLPFRTLTIDKSIISKATKNFVDKFNENLNKYNISGVEAIIVSDEYIDIKGYKKIKIEYNDENVTFSLIDKDRYEQDVFIKLRIAKEVGAYLIDYVNTSKIKPRLESFIDENTIDGILEKLFELNQEVVQIRR